jgi:hypothetical protein
MKLLILMIGLVVLLGTNADAFASGVFKCVGIDGESTFSFQPCAEIAAPVPEPVANEPVLPSRNETLAQLDSDIAVLQRQLEEAKLKYENLLSQFTGNRTDELTADFDKVASTLLGELGLLQTERLRVAQR